MGCFPDQVVMPTIELKTANFVRFADGGHSISRFQPAGF
jgi:hypothetical protein